MSAEKVQLVYCNFDDMGGEVIRNVTIKSLPLKNSTKNKPYCKIVGSQPCSCYFSKLANVTQFEQSNDEVTRQAISENGAGPKSCEELKTIGYTFDGFYMVRDKTNKIQTVYCVFNYSEKDEYNLEGTVQSTRKPISKIHSVSYFINKF